MAPQLLRRFLIIAAEQPAATQRTRLWRLTSGFSFRLHRHRVEDVLAGLVRLARVQHSWVRESEGGVTKCES